MRLGIAVTVALVAATTEAHAEPPKALVDHLSRAIGAMPITDKRRQVAVSEGSFGSSLLSFHSVDRQRLREAMFAALTRQGLTAAGEIGSLREPMLLPSTAGGTDGAFMYEVDADGTDLEVTLYSWIPGTQTIHRYDVVVDGHGAVSWSLGKLSTVGIVLLLGAGAVVWLRRRRDGDAAPEPVAAPAAPPPPAEPEPAPAPVTRASRPPTDGIPFTEGALALMSGDAAFELETAASARPAPTAAPATRPEKIRGRYRVTGELGRGAMGVVYRAFDENLEREVAIKAMSEALHDHPAAMRLFAGEAKALAQLNHPNIVSIYDQFSDGGRAYLIMELVEGRTLDRVLREQGPYAWRDGLRIAYHLCAGLAYAHGRNVIHRDIKPANIFLTSDGDVKLGDFGLARVVREVAIKSTEVRGTPLYMAPEQVTGTNIDHRADLYAVGCTMFELITGRPPFVTGEIMYQQLTMPPPKPSSILPELPLEVDRLILGLLAKNADERPASANDLRTAIRAIAA